MNVFHLTWIVSLHYLVKLEMLIGHVLRLSCYRQKLQNLSHFSCAPPKFTRFEFSWWHVGTIAREGSLIWMNYNRDWEWSGASWIMTSLRQPFVSFLYTFCCDIFHMLLSAGFKSGKFRGHSCSRINSGVSFCNDSTVAHARWAFQVPQGSVETLFRWGGKHWTILQQIYSGNYIRFRQHCRVL